MTKQIKCFSCSDLSTVTPPLKRDSDGLDIFQCPSCKTKFKLDMAYYLENMGTEDFLVKTVDANLDFSDGYDEPPKMKKKWWQL